MNKYPEHSVVRIHTETLNRIRKLAEQVDKSVPELLDDMTRDYEIDLRELSQLKEREDK